MFSASINVLDPSNYSVINSQDKMFTNYILVITQDTLH